MGESHEMDVHTNEELQAAHDGVRAPIEPTLGMDSQIDSGTVVTQSKMGEISNGAHENAFGALLKKIPGFGKK